MTTGTAALPGGAGLIFETEGNSMANEPSAKEKQRWLYRAWDMRREVESLKVAKAHSFEQVTGSTPSYSGNGGGSGSRDPHKFEKYSIISTYADAKEREYKKARDEIMKAIMKVRSSDERAVLIERYLNYRDFKEIPELIHVSESTMWRLHRTAIQHVRITRRMIEKAGNNFDSERQLKQ